MTDFPVLSVLVFLPLLGAALIFFFVGGDEENRAQRSREVALLASGVTFAVSLYLWFAFNRSDADFQFVERIDWAKGLGLSYALGVDGISLLLVLLTTLLVPLCILASWESIKRSVKEYMIAFLLMETLMIGTFSALDLILFYVFFEAVLLPMFLIIGIWGGPRRVYSAYKFFLFTLLGSVLMLIAVILLLVQQKSGFIPDLITGPLLSQRWQIWLWLAFFASFAVKLPMWPVHTWLPDAHVEAPTAGSVILAGVLLKMGGYGFLRFSLPIFPDASLFFTPLIFALSVVAVIYTSLVAFVQSDMKKLIAYSSVAHMGFVTAGLFSGNLLGLEGALFQMLSHGIISAALFLLVGVVYDRLHSREIAHYGGLVNNMPRYATVFMVFMLGAVGLPITSGFIGEFLVLAGLFKVSTWVASLVATGMILGALYMLWLYRAVIFGEPKSSESAAMPDLSLREWLVFSPLILLVFWMGIYPKPFLEIMEPALALLALRLGGG